MAVFEGGRFLHGPSVTLDGVALDPAFHVMRFSKSGFEWGYSGRGPQQLALAMLVAHMGDQVRAVELSELFMQAVVAKLDNSWRLTSEQLSSELEQL